MSSTFEIGKTYIIFDRNADAHFMGKVVKRTKCKVTFAFSECGELWCRTSGATLTVKKDSNLWDGDERVEEVCGTSWGDASRKTYPRSLYAMSCEER